MSNNRRKYHTDRAQKGFTLVELIVVLVIVAILAGIGVPAFLGYIDNAKKKEIISHGQTALSATQAALSDIFSSNDNRYDIEKRDQTRIKADAAESTEFTVWNIKALVDTKTSGGPEESVAVTEQIGSYTVGKALFKEDDNNFAAYNGSEWEWFETESDALTYLGTNKTDQNVIHVWPYMPDLAYNPGGEYVADVDEEVNDTPEEKITRRVTLKIDMLKKSAFADEGSESDTALESVTVIFTKSNRVAEIETNWKPIPGETPIKKIKKDYRFSVDSQMLLFRVFRGFKLLNWADERNGDTYADLTEIRDFVLNQEEENLSFIAQIEADAKESATLGKTEFTNFLKNAGNPTVSGISQITDVSAYLGEDDRFDISKLPGGALKVDDGGLDSKYAIYAWFEGSEIKWCTDATIAFLCPDCSQMLKGSKFQTFDFSGFDFYKTTTMADMFMECTELTGVNFGTAVQAPNLTDISGMFEYAYNLESVDFSPFQSVGGSLKQLNTNHLFYNLSGQKDELTGQEMASAKVRNIDNGGSALTSVEFGNLFKLVATTDPTYMFCGCNNLKSLDLSDWDVSSVKSCYAMFVFCQSLEEIDFGPAWNLDACENLNFMFYECDGITDGSIFAKLKAKNPTSMNNTFCKMDKVEYIDLSGIIPVNITDFQSTFRYCISLQHINFDEWRIGKNGVPTNVNSLKQTFQFCYELDNIELPNWGVSELGDSNDTLTKITFEGVKKLQTLDLTGWDCNKTLPGEVFSNSKSTLETIKLKNAKLPYESLGKRFQGYTNLKTIDMEGFEALNATTVYCLFENCSQLVSVNMKNCKFPLATDLSYMFKNCAKLETIDFDGWTTGEITSLKQTFYGCKALKSIGGTWNTQNVTDFSGLFSSCTALTTADLTNWNMSGAQNVSQMFTGCTSLQTVKMTGVDLSNVTDAHEMFKQCINLTGIQLGNRLNLTSCANMNSMFKNCIHLHDINIGSIYTGTALTNLGSCFEACFRLEEADLSNFNTENVTNMSKMFNMRYWYNDSTTGEFEGTGNSKEIYLRDRANINIIFGDGFNTSKVTDFSVMFAAIGAESLDVSGFDLSSASKIDNMFDGLDAPKEANPLTTIYASDSFEEKLAAKGLTGKVIFGNTKSIRGGNGTEYLGNSSKYAKIDREGVAGYFTRKGD